MIDRYKSIQKLRLDGKVVGYPLYLASPKLGKFVPSIPKGKCIQISASTNVGKSQFWRWYFLIVPFILFKKNPDAKFKPRFIIFLLEETYSQLYDTLVSNFIFIKHNKIVEPGKLTGLSEEIITNEELKLSESVIPLVEELLSYCKVVDNVYNPTGLFNQAKSELLDNGKRYYTTLKVSDEVITEEKYHSLEPNIKKLYKFKEYIPNDPLEYWFVITDNVNLIEGERKEGVMLTEHQAIWRWSTEYAHHQLQKNYNVIIVDIVQQAAAAESKQYTNRGENIIEKLKPSRDNYGENKKIARNADVILGLFAPSFYGVTEYWKTSSSPGYNLKAIGDYFRTIIILKNRIGRGFKEIPLFFNGATNYFTELRNEITDKDELIIKKGMYKKSFKELKNGRNS